jgi:hypothetical protein
MKFSDIPTGRFLKPPDVPSGGRRLTIESIEKELVGWPAEAKFVVYFTGLAKGLILNKTNREVLEEAFGDDTAACKGQVVELLVKDVEFKGQQVPGIRIAVPTTAPRAQSGHPGEDPDISW